MRMTAVNFRFRRGTLDSIYIKTQEGDERNWKWQYITGSHNRIDRVFEQAEIMYSQILELLPHDIPMGRLE